MKRRQFTQALAASAALSAVPYVRAQSRSLKVGVLLPRSGVQAGIGQDCHRGVQVSTEVLKALGLPKGSGEPNRNKIGRVTRAQLREIATLKMPDLNANEVEAGMEMVAGTARSMGIDVES